jgi:hypothetical protein
MPFSRRQHAAPLAMHRRQLLDSLALGGFGLALAALQATSARAAAAVPEFGLRSADGRWQLKAVGEQLWLLDAEGREVRRWVGEMLDRSRRSPVSGIAHARERQSFVVSFSAMPELWEISLNPHAEPIYHGLVHDFRMGEGVPEPGYLGARRSRIEPPIAQFTLDASGSYVLARAVDSAAGAAPRVRLLLIHLDVRRVIGRFEVAGDPDLAAATTALREGREWIDLPDRAGGAGWQVDLKRDQLRPALRP